MKVLYVVHAFSGGGIEQYILNLADHIDRKKFDIEVLGVCRYDVFSQACELKKRLIPFHRFSNSSIIGCIREYRRLLLSNKYDIVHIQGMPNAGIVWLISGKLCSPCTKFIVHSHMGIRWDVINRPKHKLISKLCYHAINLSYRIFCDIKAGCSHDSLQLHFGKTIGSKGLLLNNGIKLDNFHNSRTAKVNTRDLIIVARITPQKNPYFVLKIMAHLATKHQDWHLTWVGEGVQTEEIKHEIQRLHLDKYITLVGHRNDIPNLLWRHSLFILPSIHEAFPISLIEAQTAGCVCLSATCVPEEANFGRLLRLPLDIGPEAWADYIEKLYTEQTVFEIDKQKLAQYDIRTTSAEIERLYDSLLH